MDDCLRMCGVSGTKNGLRKQKAGSKSRRTVMHVPDDGVTPVIAVAMLIGMVAVAGIIISLAMFAALGEASGTLPDVRFQASADGKSLYHAGGDALPLKSLVFYDKGMMLIPNFQLIKGGSTEAASLEEQEVWETGDRIQFDELEGLSIVGLDSRGNPALLWRGVNAMVLPVGDMVPDVWEEIPGGGEEHNKYELYPPTNWWEKVTEAQNLSGQNNNVGLGNAVYRDGKSLYYWLAVNDPRLTKTFALTNPTLEQAAIELGNKLIEVNLSQYVYTRDDIDSGVSGSPWKKPAPVVGSLYEYEGQLYICRQPSATDSSNIWQISRNPSTSTGDWFCIGKVSAGYDA